MESLYSCPKCTIICMSEWSEELAERFGKTVQHYRKKFGLTQQELADETVKIGHGVTRSALADYELGRRKDRLPIGDALAISYALGVPLGTLLYPDMPHGNVEVVPGRVIKSLHAAQWLNGDNIPYPAEHLKDGAVQDFGLHTKDPVARAWHGSDLFRTSVLLSNAVERLESFEWDYQAAIEKTDLEQADHFRKMIDHQRDLIKMREQQVRDLGGVVDSG